MCIELIYLQNEAGRPKVAVASIDDSIDDPEVVKDTRLFEESLQIKNLNYRRQWLGTRLLLKTIEPMAGTISYTEKGKPLLQESDLNISISHTLNFCSVALSQNPAGLDLERVGEKVERISDRFLSPSEKEYANSILHKHIIWGAKEVMFKAWGEGNVQFNCDIIVSPFEVFDEGEITVDFRRSKQQLLYKKLNDLMLVYLKD